MSGSGKPATSHQSAVTAQNCQFCWQTAQENTKKQLGRCIPDPCSSTRVPRALPEERLQQRQDLGVGGVVQVPYNLTNIT